MSRVGFVSGASGSLLLAVVLLGAAGSGARGQDNAVTPFAANVTRHVLMHELGHAVFREFNIPILANEETMADSFATTMITQHRRDDAVAIVTARVRSWIYEDAEVSPADYDMKGEHDLDIRRAYQAACLLYGADPAEWAEELGWIGFSERDAADCSDTAPDQIDGWSAVTAEHRLPDGEISDNVEVVYEDSPLTAAFRGSGVMEEVAAFARRFDWPETIRLQFSRCDRGASWSRSKRRIRLCDAYLARFVRQGRALAID